MKKTALIALICCLAGLLFIAIGTVIITKGNNETWRGKNTMNYVDKTYVANGKVDEIELKLTSDSLKVFTGNTATVKIDYCDCPDKYEYVITESGGKLSFERKELKAFSLMWGVNFKDTTAVVTVPKEFEGKLTIVSSSGKIDVSGLNLEVADFKNSSGALLVSELNVSGDVTLYNTSGRIEAANVKSKAFSAQNTSGGIKINNVNADGSFNAESNSGSVKIALADITGPANIKATSGSISVNDLSAAELVAKNNSGSINLNNVKVSGTAEAKNTSGGIHFENLDVGTGAKLASNSGSIKGNIVGSESDFSIVSKTTSGGNNLTDSRSGSKTLDASATSGSIKITFD